MYMITFNSLPHNIFAPPYKKTETMPLEWASVQWALADGTLFFPPEHIIFYY